MFDGLRDDLVERVLIGRRRRAMSGARHRPWPRQTGPRAELPGWRYRLVPSTERSIVGAEHVPDVSKAGLEVEQTDGRSGRSRCLGGQEHRPLAAKQLSRCAHEGNHEQPSEGQSQDDPSAPHCLLDARALRLLP
jgi:hypothetical protein